MTFKKQQTVYTVAQAIDKAARYCALQDRCQHDVRNKMMQWGLNHTEADEALVWLITEGFVNDERFTRAFVIGKLRQNGWGRAKIVQGLKAKNISEQCIQLGFKEINEEEYEQTLEKQALKKWDLLKGDIHTKVQKTARFLLSRGFESDLVWDIVNKLKDGKSRTV
jgi:regulatory protein